jgi:hypothetical protein
MRIRSVAVTVAAVTSAMLAIGAQSACAGVPTIGQLAAATPSGTRLSVCMLASRQPVCDGVPRPVIYAMSRVPADAAGAARVARSLGRPGNPATFAYCHRDHITGGSGIVRECILVSDFV